jgi:hypothetical protein
MQINISNFLRPAALALCAVAALLCARDAHADTFTVTAVTDAPDAAPGNGVCETAPGNGVCTLRAAVMETNALAGEDVIRLPADNFALTRIGDDDTALNGDLDITGRLTIRGVQSDTSILTAGSIDRAFHLLPSAVVTLTEFTIRESGQLGGLGTDGGGVYVAEGVELMLERMIVRNNRARSGGGILNGGSLRLRDSVIRSNLATYDGGGVYVTPDSQLTVIQNSTIYSNTAIEQGGGISVRGPTTIQNSLILDNRSGIGAGVQANHFLIIVGSQIYSNTAATGPNPERGGGISLIGGLIADSHIAWNTTTGYGGGVVAHGVDVPLTIVRTTVSNNNATVSGGGIDTRHESRFNLIDSAVIGNSAITGGGIYRSSGGINVINSTVSGNVAAGRGGGIAMEPGTCFGDYCYVQLYNATVTNNTAASASDGVFVALGLELHTRNSIIANNSDADCEGTILSGGYNLIENTTGCSFLGLALYDVLGVDPKLGRLALNGGPTQNHLPASDSPAINAANPGGCTGSSGAALATDQRGLPRTARRRCDIGAVEVQPETGPEWLVYLPIAVR